PAAGGGIVIGSTEAGRGPGVLLLTVITGSVCPFAGKAAAVLKELSAEPCTIVFSACMDCTACFTACRNASADWKRCAGALAMALRIMSFTTRGSSGSKSTGGVGAWLMWAAMMEKLLSASNGFLPVTIS